MAHVCFIDFFRPGGIRGRYTMCITSGFNWKSHYSYQKDDAVNFVPSNSYEEEVKRRLVAQGVHFTLACPQCDDTDFSSKNQGLVIQAKDVLDCDLDDVVTCLTCDIEVDIELSKKHQRIVYKPYCFD